MSDDLATWLRAQLDEDEAYALNTSDEVVDWIADDTEEHGEEPAGVHIGRWLPSRVLAEVEAKRRLITEFEQSRAFYSNPANRSAPAGEVTGLWNALRIVGSAYADRPGYREEWRP